MIRVLSLRNKKNSTGMKLISNQFSFIYVVYNDSVNFLGSKLKLFDACVCLNIFTAMVMLFLLHFKALIM